MFPKAVFAPIGQVSGPTLPDDTRATDVFLVDLDTLLKNDASILDAGMASYLCEVATLQPLYFLSRLNYNDILGRVSGNVLRKTAGVFSNFGSELWVGEEQVIRHDHLFVDEVFEFLADVARKSDYPGKRSPLIDCGSATLRICLAGFNSTLKEISDYLEWESANRELDTIIDEFRARFSRYNVFRDTNYSLMISPSSFSSAIVRKHILRRNKSARIISYLSPQTVRGFGMPLKNAFTRLDVLSVVSGASDVSQLLSYELGSKSGRENKITFSNTVPEVV